MTRKKSDRYEVAGRLHSTAIHLLRRLRLEDKRSGIGPARLSALSVLVFGGPCSLKQLAAAEQVTPATMSRVVTGLVRKKLVQRETSADDARQIVLTPTAKGRQVMQEGRERRVRLLESLLIRLSEAEISRISAAVTAIRKSLSAVR
jgi:DNA-binding MarR family transcriptional regulator